MRMRVWSVGVLWNGAFKGEALRRFHIVEVGGHRAVGVFLDDKIDEATGVWLDGRGEVS